MAEPAVSNSSVTDSEPAEPLTKGKRFFTFSEVESALERLRKTGHHPLRVFNSQTGRDYNRKHADQPVDVDKFQYTYYSIRCVHSGQPRRRGKGIRPIQRSFSLGCEAKITLSYNKALNCLVVKECLLDHNHRTGEEVHKHYPSTRRLSMEESKEIVDILSLKPNNKHVRDHVVRKFGKVVTLKDIQNLKKKLREESTMGLRDAPLVLEKLTHALQDQGATGGVVVDDEYSLVILYYESSHMSKLFSKFPEILLIDGTYNINKVGMPLTCLMVEDGFGHGRVVFYAVTAREDTAHLQTIVQSFKEQNSQWESVRVIIIDKDFTEHKVLKEEFPNAVILYCQWHVIKAMYKGIVDSDVHKSDREECRRIIQLLVHAKDETQYKSLKIELYNTANKAFRLYFERNWESCKSMWVTFERDQHTHFANTTNNRLESHNQKLKDLTSRSSSLSEMFENILLYCRTSAAEYSQQSFKEEFTTQSCSVTETPTTQEIRSVYTQYAATLILEQLKLAQSVPYEFTVSETEIVVSYKQRSHVVSISDHYCSCSFRKTLQLPCRHLLAARIYTPETSVFESGLVAERWRKSYQLHAGVMPHDEDQDGSIIHHDVVVSTLPSSSVSGTLSKNQKYQKMLSLSKKIAIAASQCGMPQFRTMYSTVESMVNYIERNIPFVLTQV